METQLEKLSTNMEEGKIPRHCAFCFIPLAEKDVKKCAKCLRRVYCGKECQKKDWKSKKASRVIAAEAEGQGHKDWCMLPVCEEDLDWVVKEGGKGVVAKRLILKGERILVGNAAQYKERSGKSGVGEGMLFNHACGANSYMNHGMDFNVSIITAERDIQPGIEITVNYVGFGDDFVHCPLDCLDARRFALAFAERKSLENSRKELETKYGITCEKDCFCYNKEIEQLIDTRNHVICLIKFTSTSCRENDPGILQNVVAGFDAVEGRGVKKAQMICIFLDAQRRTEKGAKFADLVPIYEKEAEEIFKSVFHPKSPYSKVKGWMDYFGVKLH